MATERQIEANRRNAAMSTGPRSDEGKARSRGNATRHGLAGESAEVAETANSAAFLARREAWAGDFRPSGQAANWALDRAVAASLRIEKCERTMEALVVSHANRSRLAWDQDRQVEAATLAAGIAKAPMMVARKLAATDQGAALLIEIWARLDACLDQGDWSEAECSTALDLLGVHPELRTGLTPIDDPEQGDPLAYHRSIVDREITRLAELRERALGELDDFARDQAMGGDLAMIGVDGRRVLRYERDAWRRFRESIRDLQAQPQAPAAEAPAAPAPVAAKPTSQPAISAAEMADLMRRYAPVEPEAGDTSGRPGAEIAPPATVRTVTERTQFEPVAMSSGG